jgi:predicted AAA+ superfamily ATPase
VKEYRALRKELSLKLTYWDIIIRGHNTIEEEIEYTLVSNFGKKLSLEEIKNITVLRITPPDIRFIWGNKGYPRVRSKAIPQG